MSEFTIERVGSWLGGTTDAEDATFGALKITAGTSNLPLTEVDDSLAKTTRAVIRVPLIRVAEWLALRWWRLRWEARPTTRTPSIGWRQAHSMTAIGGGMAWPPLEIWSDGESVQLTLNAESQSDVAGIRYIRDVQSLEVRAIDFERAVDSFLDLVNARLQETVPHYDTLADIRAELAAERSDQVMAQRCRWQARAGIDPGDAQEGWIDAIARTARETGGRAMEDALAVAGSKESPATVATLVEALAASPCTVDLGKAHAFASSLANTDEVAWKRGVAGAQAARKLFGAAEGPLSDGRLGELLGLKLPATPTGAPPGDLSGALRENGGDVTRVLVRTPRIVTQRFYFARVLGLAGHFAREEHLLPITSATTSVQKLSRAFAQEFLCPWTELNLFTDEEGTGDEAIATVADRYGVSEMLITTTLVNRGKIDRDRLARFVA